MLSPHILKWIDESFNEFQVMNDHISEFFRDVLWAVLSPIL